MEDADAVEEIPDYCERRHCVRVASYRLYNEELGRDELLCDEHYREASAR